MTERLLVDTISIEGADIAVSISREPGFDQDGAPFQEARAGNVLPRLCQFAGQSACKLECQAPVDYDNKDKECATANGAAVWQELGVRRSDVYLAVVTGSANVQFLDSAEEKASAKPNAEGYHSFAATDGLFGYADTVKACRLADCGMLAVTGVDKAGKTFDGFIHATRNNMNGDNQFTDGEGQPIGGVTKMLQEVQRHYEPQEMKLRLVAGIAPTLYRFDFTPTEKDLQVDPTLTAERKRETMFQGWTEKGWIQPAADEAGDWDGKTYTVDMFAAVRSQVEQAGLADVYSDDGITINGELHTGHASNRAGKHGKVAEARDFYAVVPVDYDRI